jgi:hypothetical protein
MELIQNENALSVSLVFPAYGIDNGNASLLRVRVSFLILELTCRGACEQEPEARISLDSMGSMLHYLLGLCTWQMESILTATSHRKTRWMRSFLLLRKA